MPVLTAPPITRAIAGYKQWLPDLRLGLQNLLANRMRSLLTMLGRLLVFL